MENSKMSKNDKVELYVILDEARSQANGIRNELVQDWGDMNKTFGRLLNLERLLEQIDLRLRDK